MCHGKLTKLLQEKTAIIKQAYETIDRQTNRLVEQTVLREMWESDAHQHRQTAAQWESIYRGTREYAKWLEKRQLDRSRRGLPVDVLRVSYPGNQVYHVNEHGMLWMTTNLFDWHCDETLGQSEDETDVEEEWDQE